MMDLRDRLVVVVGLARTGMATARFLMAQGARVTLTDRREADGLGSLVAQARELGVGLELGGHPDALFEAARLIVLSPGVPHTLAPFRRARARGVEVIGEVELASRFIATPMVAVTGTNGKTTTTELLGHMLAASGKKVFVGGNIGNPLIEVAGRDTNLELIVVELSSFQLDTIATMRPRVGVLLNITPDHLDRYADIQAYADSKGRIFENQGDDDVAVCNGNDPLAMAQCRKAAGRVLKFYTRPPENGHSGSGAIVTPRQVAVCPPGMSPARIDLSRTALLGPHNRENIAAAALAALAAGGTLEGVQKAVDAFQGLAHRLEPVGTVRQVRFVNDSKATNVDAARRALECFGRPVVMIMGGRNKGYDFADLRETVRRHVKKLIVIGEAGDEIMAALGAAPAGGAQKAVDMDQAVREAYAAAEAGDTVLLSPACASFDMFGSYAERGEAFRRMVEALT